MTFDELQKRWQSQESGFRLSIDSDMLLREVKRNKRYFELIVFWRDVREAGLCFVMFLFFGYVGLEENFWPLILLALLVLFVAVFLVVDRIVQKGGKKLMTSKGLTSCIEGSLVQVNHQIWLLKNVFWWYLLPMFTGLFIFVGYTAWDARDHIPWFMFDIAYMAVVVLFMWYVYRLNQKGIRKELEPRKEELEQLLNSLKNANGI